MQHPCNFWYHRETDELLIHVHGRVRRLDRQLCGMGLRPESGSTSGGPPLILVGWSVTATSSTPPDRWVHHGGLRGSDRLSWTPDVLPHDRGARGHRPVHGPHGDPPPHGIRHRAVQVVRPPYAPPDLLRRRGVESGGVGVDADSAVSRPGPGRGPHVADRNRSDPFSPIRTVFRSFP